MECFEHIPAAQSRVVACLRHMKMIQQAARRCLHRGMGRSEVNSVSDLRRPSPLPYRNIPSASRHSKYGLTLENTGISRNPVSDQEERTCPFGRTPWPACSPIILPSTLRTCWRDPAEIPSRGEDGEMRLVSEASGTACATAQRDFLRHEIFCGEDLLVPPSEYGSRGQQPLAPLNHLEVVDIIDVGQTEISKSDSKIANLNRTHTETQERACPGACGGAGPSCSQPALSRRASLVQLTPRDEPNTLPYNAGTATPHSSYRTNACFSQQSSATGRRAGKHKQADVQLGNVIGERRNLRHCGTAIKAPVSHDGCPGSSDSPGATGKTLSPCETCDGGGQRNRRRRRARKLVPHKAFPALTAWQFFRELHDLVQEAGDLRDHICRTYGVPEYTPLCVRCSRQPESEHEYDSSTTDSGYFLCSRHRCTRGGGLSSTSIGSSVRTASPSSNSLLSSSNIPDNEALDRLTEVTQALRLRALGGSWRAGRGCAGQRDRSHLTMMADSSPSNQSCSSDESDTEYSQATDVSSIIIDQLLSVTR